MTQGVGTEPRVLSVKETTEDGFSRGHSISHSLLSISHKKPRPGLLRNQPIDIPGPYLKSEPPTPLGPPFNFKGPIDPDRVPIGRPSAGAAA